MAHFLIFSEQNDIICYSIPTDIAFYTTRIRDLQLLFQDMLHIAKN